MKRILTELSYVNKNLHNFNEAGVRSQESGVRSQESGVRIKKD